MDTSFECDKKDSTVEWLTPKYIIDDLGPFDLDPCSPIQRPWDTAIKHYTREDDGLSKLWQGFVWCNPPYGNETKVWLDRLSNHSEGGIALTFARTETKMFFDSVWNKYSGVMFVKGRIKFCLPDGTVSGSPGAPSVLIGYGEEALRRLAVSKIDGHLIVTSAYIILDSNMKPIETWREVIEKQMNGRTFHLKNLYTLIEGSNKVKYSKAKGIKWKEKIRKILQKHFVPIKRGVWSPAYV